MPSVILTKKNPKISAHEIYEWLNDQLHIEGGGGGEEEEEKKEEEEGGEEDEEEEEEEEEEDVNTNQIDGLKRQVYVNFKTEQNVVHLISTSTT
jgi:hypothetical protein